MPRARRKARADASARSERMGRPHGTRIETFGAFLETIRKRALGPRASFEQVDLQLREKKLPRVTKSSLHRYEKKRGVPDVVTLWALAQLYDLEPYALMRTAIAAATDPMLTKDDLLKIAEAPASPADDAPRVEQIWALKQQERDLRARIDNVREASQTILRLVEIDRDAPSDLDRVQVGENPDIQHLQPPGGASGDSPAQASSQQLPVALDTLKERLAMERDAAGNADSPQADPTSPKRGRGHR